MTYIEAITKICKDYEISRKEAIKRYISNCESDKQCMQLWICNKINHMVWDYIDWDKLTEDQFDQNVFIRVDGHYFENPELVWP